jgi:hypothetical protein
MAMEKAKMKCLDLSNGRTPQLKVWWIPQVPMKETFTVLLSSFSQAKVLLEALAQYDLFQFDNRIKPDYCNVGGLMILEEGEWIDFETVDCEDIDSLTLDQCLELDRQNHR